MFALAFCLHCIILNTQGTFKLSFVFYYLAILIYYLIVLYVKHSESAWCVNSAVLKLPCLACNCLCQGAVLLRSSGVVNQSLIGRKQTTL